MVKTQYIAAYDVTDDDLRNLTADLLKNAGMERIQYSVFYGELTRNEAEELVIHFKEETIDHNAQLILIPICESCSKKQIIAVNEGDCPHNEEKEDEEEPETQRIPQKTNLEENLTTVQIPESKVVESEGTNYQQSCTRELSLSQLGREEQSSARSSNTSLQSTSPSFSNNNDPDEDRCVSNPNPSETRMEDKQRVTRPPPQNPQKVRNQSVTPLDEVKTKRRTRVIFY